MGRPSSRGRGVLALAAAVLLASGLLPPPAAGSRRPGNPPRDAPPPVFAAAYDRVIRSRFDWLSEADLAVRGFEITQGIQCFDTGDGLASCPDNSLRLVAGKPTAARIYVRYDSRLFGNLNNVPVRFHLRTARSTGWTTVDATGRALATFSQDSVDDSVNVYFEIASEGSVDFYAEVDPDGAIAETDETNNRYPAIGYTTLSFSDRRSLRIVGRRLDYHPSGYGGTRQAAGWAVNGGAAQWLEQVLPIEENGIDYQVASGYLDWTDSLSGEGDHDLIQSLNADWVLELIVRLLFGALDELGDHVYGWTPDDGYSGGHADMPVYPHAGGLGVVGIGTDDPGTSTDDPGRGGVIFGHELVHDYDVYHTDTADSCGSSDSNSDFPYTSSSIQEFGFNPVTGKVYDPASTHDLMSYCPPGSREGWISPFTWEKMFDDLASGSASSPRAQPLTGPAALQAGGPVLVVNAIVSREGGGTLGPLYRLREGISYNPRPDPQGAYAVELRDGEGEVLHSERFRVNFDSEYGGRQREQLPEQGIALSIPWQAGTRSIVLTDAAGVVLDQRAVSDTPPRVRITTNTEPETWKPGTRHALRWRGTDGDGDSLTYAVFYSNDGKHWQLLAAGLRGTAFRVGADDLAGGGSARFRVLATDGVLTHYDETDATFEVANKRPSVLILHPRSGARIPAGSLTLLVGQATDVEDGDLPGRRMVWSSDRQGVLGTTPVLPTRLKPGQHVVTLRATDPDGASASRRIRVYVSKVRPPTVDPEPSGPGQQVRARAAFTDPSPSEGPYSCEVDYGDGSPPVAGEVKGDVCIGAAHVYEQEGTSTVVISVSDQMGEVGTSFADHSVRGAPVR